MPNELLNECFCFTLPKQRYFYLSNEPRDSFSTSAIRILFYNIGGEPCCNFLAVTHIKDAQSLITTITIILQLFN